MNRSGKLIVISGPSGVGKTTICGELLKLPGFERVVTCTTRAPRPGEKDGVHYRFLTRDQFTKGIKDGMFLEYATVHTNLYGTPRQAVEDGFRRGAYVLLAIDVQGASQVRSRLAKEKMTSIFLLPPDDSTLAARLAGRGTEGSQELQSRLHTSKAELLEQENYDFRIVNDVLKETVESILHHVDYSISRQK